MKITHKEFKHERTNNTTLSILFIGELSTRKGVDILLEVIKNSPPHFHFFITSDGPMREQVKQLASEKSNCSYLGYVSNDGKERLYQKADVFILPSRGEGFPLAILEAMAHGLLIVDSQDIRLDLPEYIEYTSEHNRTDEYLVLLNTLYKEKQSKNFSSHKKSVFDYCSQYLSEDIIFSQLRDKLFTR